MKKSLLLCALIAIGCGGKKQDKETPAPDPPMPAPTDPTPVNPAPVDPAPVADVGGCDVKVTGIATLEEKGPGGSMAMTTDYWLTQEELEQMVKAMTPDPAKQKEALAKDPILQTLIVNCLTPNVRLNLLGKGGYKDVPFAPGTYALNAKDSKIGGMLSVNNRTYKFTGTLDITRWDTSGFVATYQLDASDMFDKNAPLGKLTGKFDFPCTMGKKCTK